MSYLRLDPPRSRYDSAYKTLAFYDRLRNTLAAFPGAEVSAVFPLSVSGDGWGGSYELPERLTTDGAELQEQY